jgi:lipopolysaccharide transport system ATP-binding protein
MSDAIITVEQLSKRYIIGRKRPKDEGIRHIVEDAVRAPFKWLTESSRAAEKATKEEFWALQDVSFEIKRGDVVGVVGRNGAGKSTLLKVLSRITEPTTGRISIDGRVASLLEVGTGFHPELTGRENIYLNGAILGMSRVEIKRKFDEIVAFSEVEKFLDTPVKRYSSGMYVRLAFAVAAHLEPEILVVDEVLAVGDAQFQKKCLGKMSEVAKGGRTVLFVSHNMAAVMNLCKNCLLMEKGRLTMYDESEKVISAFLNEARQVFRFARNHVMDGDRRVIIDNVEVVTRPLQTGAPFSCVVHLNRAAESTGELSAEISVDIISDREARLIQLFSHNTGREFLIPPGKSRFQVDLPQLPLAPGCYSLSVWVGYGYTTFDLVWDCYSMVVESGAYQNGPYIENRGFPLVPNCRWATYT